MEGAVISQPFIESPRVRLFPRLLINIFMSQSKKFDGDIRLSYSITEDVNRIDKLKHPIVRNVLKLLGIKGGIEIASMADIPSKGSGLGSSSSYTVALLHALYTYKNSHISKV